MSTLLLVHAHPDDESILTGGVIARAHRDGHRVVLLTATRGETDPHERPAEGAPPPSPETRTAELLAACQILGVDRQEFLGYRATSMPEPGVEPVADPACLRDAPLDEIASRVSSFVREERPDVVVTYGADGTYGHPDHVRSHQATLAGLDVLASAGWAPAKLYAHAVPRSFVLGVTRAAVDGAIALPASLRGVQGTPDDEITTSVDVANVLDVKLAACVAHASQMHPGLALAAIAAELFLAAFGVERFVLLRGQLGADRPEPDLFAGV